MNQNSITFAELDRRKGIPPPCPAEREEMSLPAWYRSIYSTPFQQFAVSDLSRAVAQRLHLEETVPFAIERLRADPLAGEMFDGQLLAAFRSIDREYWIRHGSEADALRAIINQASINFPDEMKGDAQEILATLLTCRNSGLR